MTNTSLTHWSTYWQTGARHSLPQDFGANYDRELAEFWAPHFTSLTADSAVLDVCTGTGAIPMLARQLSSSHAFKISAIDGASVESALLQAIWSDQADQLASIEFRFATPVESMGDVFGSASFDLITSQYGLEYCTLDTAASQVATVLKPQGQLVMVTHANSTEMSKTMAAEAHEYDLLAEVGYLKLLGSWSKGQLSAQNLKDRLERAVKVLIQHQSKTESLLSQVIESMRVALSQPLGHLLAQGIYAQQYLDQLQAAKTRLDDMQRVTNMIGEGQADTWLEPFYSQGLRLVSRADIRIDGSHLAGVGWVLQRDASAL